MNSLNISTGLTEFDLNGKVTVSFNPVDPAFMEKVFNTFDELDAKQDEAKELVENADTKEAFKIMNDMNKEMRAKLEELFGIDVCTPLIGDGNIYALADGAPIWANILLAVVDTMELNMDKERKASKARLAKYTAKYESQDHRRKNK